MTDENFKYTVDDLISRYPVLTSCKEDIIKAYEILEACFASNNKLLVAGNGGSAADSEHIVGELMKGFKKRRKVDDAFATLLKNQDFTLGSELANKLQRSLTAISLVNHPGLNTAYLNDVENGGNLAFSQQINGLGNKGDVFLAISTSGNSKNLVYATITAKAKGMKVIALTGKTGGKLKNYVDVTIKVDETETFKIQELHLPIYHLLCLMLEERFF